MALLFRDFDKRIEIRSTRDGLIRFRRYSEAVAYLRENRERPGLTAALRQALAEHHGLDVRRLTDDQVIEEASQRLLNGSLQLMEIFEARAEVSTAVKGLLAEQTEEPIVVEEAPPPPTPKAPEPVPEETVELQAEAKLEPMPELATGAEVEELPALATESEVEEPPMLDLETQIKEPDITQPSADPERPRSDTGDDDQKATQ